MGKVIRCKLFDIKANVRAKVAAATPPPNPKESHHPDIVTSTSPKDKDILEVSSELYFMIPEEDAPLSRSTSETHINSKSKLSTSSQLKDPTQDSTFLPEEKPPSQPEIFFPSAEFLKEPPSAILSQKLEIKEVSQDAQEPMPPSSVILKMVQKQELDCLLELEKQSMETAEPQ